MTTRSLLEAELHALEPSSDDVAHQGIIKSSIDKGPW